MKTEEDEAFDDLAKKQGSWGGGFPAKRAMAADKFIAAEERKVGERYGYVPKLHPSEWMNDHNEDNLDMVAQPAQEPSATRPCRSCNGTGERWTGIDEAPTSICKPCDGTGQIALAQPVQERCCYHDSDCAVHNMPAYPAGACDCTQQFKFWSVTGKYERQAFASLASAEAYCKGLNTTHPEGNYIVCPLLEMPALKRPWVGLTDDELADLWYKESLDWMEFARAHETALKEKNNGT